MNINERIEKFNLTAKEAELYRIMVGTFIPDIPTGAIDKKNFKEVLDCMNNANLKAKKSFLHIAPKQQHKSVASNIIRLGEQQLIVVHKPYERKDA